MKGMMVMKEDLISKIVALEWQMFQNVSNEGGRASCQEDHQTFEIMRSSQAMDWSDDVLVSYLEDLAEAEKVGRNLLSEKYARMMKSTAPLEYARLADYLPPLAPETISLIDEIVKINLAWETELLNEFPYICKRGRPVNSSEDSPHVTSIETYLRGELATYSPRTLKLYHHNVLRQKSEQINGSRIVLEYTMGRYGFNSLAEANEKLKMRA